MSRQPKQKPEKHSQLQQPQEVNIDELIKAAQELPPDREIFSNYVRMTLQGTEMYLDFYTLEPTPGEINPPVAKFRARVIMPVFMAKGFVSGLANVILNHEANTGGELPDLRGHWPNDKVDVWELVKQGGED